MSKTQTTRTLNPLPFEHMENRRFEDLVRQLAYDFKPWRQLEATGRSGSDSGFDARGYETVTPANSDVGDPDNDEDLAGLPPETDRLWLIQCKREKVIGPSKIIHYLEEISPEEISKLHGVLFVAACDFSKKTRDAFRDWCRSKGISEAHIWGKGEIEDLLFQPKNDGLLFAYFGISLAIRRTKHKTVINHELAIKRKLVRIEKERGSWTHILIRDPTDDRYPYKSEDDDQRWIPLKYERCGHAGVKFEWWRYYASLDENGQWDAANVPNCVWTNGHLGDPWGIHDANPELRSQAHKEWSALPEEKRAWFTLWVYIPYEKIIAIDEIGDEMSDLPHMHIVYEQGKVPIADEQSVEIKPIGYTRSPINPLITDRIQTFSPNLRKPFGKEKAEENTSP